MTNQAPNHASGTMKLNFIPVKSQEFSFTVYRKLCESLDESRADDEVMRFSLPTLLDSEERNEYWISFIERAGFERFSCSQIMNRRLTLRYLIYSLHQLALRVLSSSDLLPPENNFSYGFNVVLSSNKYGSECIWIEAAYVTPLSQLGFLIDFHFVKNPSVPFDKNVQRLSLSLDRFGNSNRDFYSDKYRQLQRFVTRFGALLLPDYPTIDLQDIGNVFPSISTSRLNGRELLFSDGHTGYVPFTGVDRYGPFVPLEHPIRFALIYSEGDKPLMLELASALMGRSNEVPFKGIVSTFRLKTSGSVDMSVPVLSQSQIPAIVDNLILERQELPDSKIIPLIVMTKDDPSLYNNLKYTLLNNGFSAQVVTSEKIRDRATFKWAVADIALQIFAKAGGRPWCVVPSSNNCVIFGLGQAHERNREGFVRRYFSYLVCTDTTGVYRRTDVLGDSTSESEYITKLRQQIVNVVREELASGYTKCVLHVPFRLKHNELQAIEDAISEVRSTSGYGEMQFVVLRINTDSRYFGFADTNSLVPYEGTILRVGYSPSMYLVWFEGLQQGNPVLRKRPGGPVQIEFHWPKSELKYAEELMLLQDVLNLSGCNWTGFKSSHLPISIFYCQLIAKHMKRFAQPSINIHAISEPWFL